MDKIFLLLTNNVFFENIVIGIMGAITLKALHLLYTKIINYIYLNNHFSISGIWIAEFDTGIKNKRNIEIINIKQNKESIIFYLEQYNSLSSEIIKYRGRGIFRGSEFTAIYFPISKNDMQNGALILRVIHAPGQIATLDGIFSEFACSEKITDIVKGNYQLQRFDLPLSRKIAFYIYRSYFNNYEELLKYKRNYPTSKI